MLSQTAKRKHAAKTVNQGAGQMKAETDAGMQVFTGRNGERPVNDAIPGPNM